MALRLLVIAGDHAERRTLRDALVAALPDAELVEAADLAAMVERLSSGPAFDCLVVGAGIPDHTAEELLRRLRAANEPAAILAVIATGDGEPLLDAGASDHIALADVGSARLAQRVRNAVRVGNATAKTTAALRQRADERAFQAAVFADLPMGVVVCDAAGERILFANARIEASLGPLPHGGALAEALERIGAVRADGSRVRPEDWPLARAIATGAPVEDELRLRDVAGQERVVRVAAAPVRSGNLQVVGASMTVEDVTVARRQSDAAVRAAGAREEILAVVSHDLRNPLNAVSIAVTELADETLDAATRQSLVGAIRRAVGRADKLIGDLLDASRIMAGNLVVQPRSVEVRALLEQAARDHQLVAAAVGLEIVVDMPIDVGAVLGDRDRVLQALANLISNAIRYAPRSGRLELAASRGDGSVTMEVRDRGPGIATADLPHIFARFYQGGRQRRGGAGLGLAIVDGIARAHGGRVEARSLPGEGATFALTLPAVSP